MKTYYRLLENTNLNEVGVYEQIQEFIIPFTKLMLDKFSNLQLNRRKFFNDLPEFSKFRISNEAVMTDVLTCKFIPLSVGLIASEKVHKILGNYNLSHFTNYEIKVNAEDKESQDYYFYHILEDKDSIIFKNSKFSKRDFLDIEQGAEIKINSLEEYYEKNLEIQKNDPGYYLSCDEVYLNQEIDLIRLPGSPVVNVSERLIDVFKENNISGLSYGVSECNFEIKP